MVGYGAMPLRDSSPCSYPPRSTGARVSTEGKPGHDRRDSSGKPRFARTRFCLLLCLWLAVTGVHWDVVQVFAWGEMWAKNIQTETFSEAVSSTFAPEKMCKLCELVQGAEQSADQAAVTFGKTVEKAPLLPLEQNGTVVDAPVAVVGVVDTVIPPLARGRMSPPVPPPRAAFSRV